MSDHHGDHHDGQAASRESPAGAAADAHDHGDTMGFHGMVALGTHDIYLTHLAMRSGPHMFQVLCRVHFEATPETHVSEQALVDAGTTDLTDIYRQDRVNTSNPMMAYTVTPTSNFELADLATGQMDRFRANVTRGHFERDPDHLVLLTGISVVIDALTHSHHLHIPAAEEDSPRTGGTVPHLLFGAGDEFFLCHRVSLHGREGTASDCGYHQIFALDSESARDLAFELRDGTVEISTAVSNLAPSGRLPAVGGPVAFDLSHLTSQPPGSIVSDVVLAPEHYLEILMG